MGESKALKSVIVAAKQVAPTDTTVLILGETGTGKGLVANAIHQMSARKDRPLVTVNCTALPQNLIESELFGREKGAFTGAHDRQAGRFEVVDGGTINLSFDLAELLSPGSVFDVHCNLLLAVMGFEFCQPVSYQEVIFLSMR